MCDSLTVYARSCGKNSKAGVNSDVYLVAFSDLQAVSGSTEVFSQTTNGMISAIALSGDSKFVKYGTVQNQASIKEDYTYSDNGTYDITKQLVFNLNNLGSITAYAAVDVLISNPVAALVKLKNGTWLAFGLNGQFMAKTVAGTADSSSNGRVITLSGSDDQFLQVVDPTIIAGLIS